MNNVVFRKTMENVRKHRDTKLATTKRRRNYLVSEPNFHTTKFFTETLLAIETKKSERLMNKRVYLWLLIVKLSYMDQDIVCIKTDDIYEGTAEDIKTRFVTSNYELSIA